uniref:Azurin, chimeric construct n=1 Tax=Pseudomonas aeruginosa TaxID=287 RepID=UPI000B9503E6|nr:Chain A, Azurin, chimeric construct [synthetic construct]5SYD_B Chain B, Azurin, chimeric construct [synthetic construct]
MGVMGHNWVLSTAADMQGVVTDGMASGLDKDYLKPDDSRVIAHTKLIGSGEKDSVTFDVSKLKEGEQYMFFCTFPGHSALMKGTLTLKGIPGGAECSVDIQGNDQMQFNTNAITVDKSCKQFTVNLSHPGN